MEWQKIARLINLNLYKQKFDFYGDEFYLFTKHWKYLQMTQ